MTDHQDRTLHLTLELAAAVRRGEATSEFLQGFLLRHALERPDAARGESSALSVETHGTHTPEGYERVLRHAARTLAGLDGLERKARRELAELLETPAASRRRGIERARQRFRSPILAGLLIEEARKAVRRDPEESTHLARLAVAVCHRIDTTEHGAGRKLETLARAIGYEANGQRAGGNLEAAEGRLDFALRCIGRVEWVDPLVPAELDGLLATLRADQRRFEEAQELLDRGIACYRECGEPARATHSLLMKAAYLYYQGRFEEAATVLADGRALVTPEDNPWLCLCAEHQLTAMLCQMGRFEEAREKLEAHRTLYARFGERTRLRLQWMRASIAQGLGEEAEAECLYTEAKDGFFEQDTGYDAVLVGLDLATLYLEQGRSENVRHLAQEMLPVFWGQEVHREAMGALLLFQDAAEKETASVELVRRIAAYLEQARNNPGLRFEELED